MQTPLFEILGFGGGMTLSDTIGNENQFDRGYQIDFTSKPGKLTCGRGWSNPIVSGSTTDLGNSIFSIYRSTYDNGTTLFGDGDNKILSGGAYSAISLLHDLSGSSQRINDIIEYKDYLYFSQETNIARFDMTTAWADEWQHPLTLSSYRQSYVSNNNSLYFTNGQYVASWDDTTFASAALDLSDNWETNCIDDFGWKYLAVGCSLNEKGYKKSKVILWDRTSDSWNDEIIIPESHIHAMIFSAGYLWIWGGNNANLYVVPEDSRRAIKMFSFTKEDETSLKVYPNSVCERDGIIYFGLSDDGALTERNSSIHPRNSTAIYSFPVDPNNFALNVRYKNKDQVEKFYCIEPVNVDTDSEILYTFHRYGYSETEWKNYLIREKTSKNEYPYGSGYYESFTYKAPANKRLFTESFGVDLDPLPTGCAISLSYKKEGDTTWTSLFSNFNTADATEKIVLKKFKAKFIKLRLQITGYAESPSAFVRPYVNRIWVTGHLIPRLPH